MFPNMDKIKKVLLICVGIAGFVVLALVMIIVMLIALLMGV